MSQATRQIVKKEPGNVPQSHPAKAFAAFSPTSAMAPFTVPRRSPRPQDVPNPAPPEGPLVAEQPRGHGPRSILGTATAVRLELAGKSWPFSKVQNWPDGAAWITVPLLGAAWR